MADINIQRKKKSLSPWLAVLLALLVAGLVWFFFFRPEPGPMPAADPAASPATAQPLDSALSNDEATNGSDNTVHTMASEQAVTPESFYTFAANEVPTAAEYSRRGLGLLAGVLIDLADRDDLRQDAAVQERRNDLTSATSRLDEPGVSLRPGFLATAALIQAMQQKAYPHLAVPVLQLTRQAASLTGQAEPAEQLQQQTFFQQAAQVLQQFS